MIRRWMAVDDETPALAVIKRHMETREGYACIGLFTRAQEALVAANSEQPDLLFLDQDMPSLSGLDLLAELATPTVAVMVTAHAEYALEAFERGVRDYLLKPVSPERLAQTLSRIEPLLNTEVRLSVLSFKNGHDRILADPRTVTRFSAEGNYAYLHRPPARPVLITESLRSLEQRLTPFGFMRVHKAHLVRVTAVERIAGNKLLLSGAEAVPLGRAYAASVRMRLANG